MWKGHDGLVTGGASKDRRQVEAALERRLTER